MSFEDRLGLQSTTAEVGTQDFHESSVEEGEPVVVLRSNRAHSAPVVIDLTDSDVEPNTSVASKPFQSDQPCQLSGNSRFKCSISYGIPTSTATAVAAPESVPHLCANKSTHSEMPKQSDQQKIIEQQQVTVVSAACCYLLLPG